MQPFLFFYKIILVTILSSWIWPCHLALLSGTVDIGLIEKCCTLGSNWSSTSRQRCTRYPEENLPLDITEDGERKDNCLAISNLCCLQTARSQYCQVGSEIAKSESSSCSSIKVVGGNTEKYTHQKECCDCCSLGMAARNCDLLETFGRICERSADCCEAFYNCCNSTSSVISSGVVTMTLATTTPAVLTTTSDPSELPVHTPNGICAKFSSALCEHFCHDAPEKPNKFRCTCRKGFELAPNRRNCAESLLPSPTCASGQTCDNTAECYMRRGVPICRCKTDGFRLVDGHRCEDIDECAHGTNHCLSSQTCRNTEGSFTCTDIVCPSTHKYDMTSKTCIRKEETRTVPTTTSCRNRDMIYDHATGSCLSSLPVANSSCPHGYAISVAKGTCEDVDECAIGWNDCDVGQSCVNTVGSYVCRRRLSCGTGYTLQEISQACIDIDECALATHNCGPAFTCHNLPGSFRCEYKVCPREQRLNLTNGQCIGATKCDPGFAWTEYTRRCEDVDECLYENPCLPGERCANTDGSYRCISSSQLTCYNGFKVNNAGTSCHDINECEDRTHNCQSDEHCTNTQGSFKCRCDVGYALNAVHNTCEDVNECSRASGQFCSPTNSICVNTPGSFYCQCNKGFKSIVNGRACKDVDECLNSNICQHKCNNLWGTYQCRCHAGYRLAEDKQSCNDINECELSATRGRLCNGFCENVLGSFRCVCPAGFRLSANGRECLDIDECEDGSASCQSSNQICVNTRGSFKCNVVDCPRYFAAVADTQSRSSVRCARQTFVCSQGDVECLTAPLSLSFNFLTLSANRIRIPTELFTMRGPDTFPRIEFQLDVKSIENLQRNSIRVTRDHFSLHVDPDQQNVAVVSIVLPIVGQQEIKLMLNMNIYNADGFFGTAAATITIYATVDGWEELGR